MSESSDGHGFGVVVITNGNLFARIILAPLLSRFPKAIRGVILVERRRPDESLYSSARQVAALSGTRYTLYKAFTTRLPPAFICPNGSLERFCGRRGIQLLRTSDANGADVETFLTSARPGLLISVSCPQILEDRIIGIPTSGAWNVHSSLLPEYAGLAPYFWVLAHGRSRTGTTVHLMDSQPDEGLIVVQRELTIPPSTTMFSLFLTLSRLGGSMLADAFQEHSEGKVDPKPQQGEWSYYSQPTRDAYAQLRGHGHRLFGLGDVGEYFAALKSLCKNG